MAYRKLMTSVALVTALGVVGPATVSAQSRGRAVPRGSVRVVRPPVTIVPSYRPYVRTYRPAVNLGFFYGRPSYFGPYVAGSPFYGYGYPVAGFRTYGYPAYGYPVSGYAPYGYVSGYAPYGYGYGGYSGRPYGGVRIDLPQRDAEVYVDGYFVGTVDNFDGVLQQANIEAGPHKIEVRAPGFDTIVFDVNVEPGQTITYRASMRPLQP